MKRFVMACLCFISIFAFASCRREEVDIKALCPGGAPALSQALMENNKKISTDITYSVDRVSDTTLLQAGFTNGEYDMIFAPINLGVRFYSVNQKYKMLANVTWGNLYFASCKEDFTLNDLNGSDIVFFGKGTINEYIVNSVLQEKAITPKTTTYLASTADTKNYLVANPNSICLIAEPVLSAASVALKTQGLTVTTISVQDLWEEANDGESYPQAAVFVKSEIFDTETYLIEKIYKALADSIQYCNEDIEGVSLIATNLEYGLPAAGVLKQAIPNSNIRIKSAKDSKSMVEKVMKLMGTEKIEEDFFAY